LTTEQEALEERDRMTPEERLSPLEEPTPTPETPDVQSLLERYRLLSRTHRQRRRRHVLAIGGLVAGSAAVLVAMLSLAPEGGQKADSTAPEPVTSSVSALVTEQPRLEPRAPEPRPSPARTLVASPSPPTRAPATPRPPAVTAHYQPSERLGAVRPGDAKERVFAVLGGTVERRNGTLVRMNGIRLRASGRSADHPRVEVADVEVGERGVGTRYWFLFGHDRLLAWGRPEEWPAAAARYKIEIDYR
jgi:hypothetical protein